MNEFTRVFVFLISMAFLLGGFIVLMLWVIISWITPDGVRSDKPIKPKIELVLKNNKVDTIYIYKDEK